MELQEASMESQEASMESQEGSLYELSVKKYSRFAVIKMQALRIILTALIMLTP